MRVLVSGSRAYPDDGYIASVLERFHEIEAPINLVIHGDAPTTVADLRAGKKSADQQAKDWALSSGIPPLGIPAAWDFYKKPAGGIRNGWLLVYGAPDLVLAFPTDESRGTWDMVRKAKDSGCRVIVDDHALSKKLVAA